MNLSALMNLVENLRAAAIERHEINIEGDPIRFRDSKVEDDLRWQAADEIERLQKRLATWETKYKP